MKKSLTAAALLSALASTCGPVSAQSAYSFNINGHHVDIAVPRHCADLSCISVWTGPVGPARRADRRRPPRDSEATAEPTTPKPRAPKKAAKAPPVVTQPTVARPAPPASSAPSTAAQTQAPASRPSTAPAAPTSEAKKAEAKAPDPNKSEAEKPASAAPVDTAKAPTVKPNGKVDPAPPATTEAQQAAKPVPPPAVPETKPSPPTSDLVKRADTEALTPDVASGRGSSESAASAVDAPSPQPSPAAQIDDDREAGSANAADARVPLPPAEQKRIVNALNAPATDAASEASDDATASPLGFWITELDAEKIHIVPCGKELCGYAIDPKTEQDRAEPLIRMKPLGARKWSGRINDARGTGSYASTISQKEADILHVQGCAFKNFMCDGQIWRRAS